MNKTHRIVWSAARQAYIVAHEHATACGKPASTRAAAVLVAGLLAAAPALASTTCTDLAGSAKVTLSDGKCATLAQGGTLEVTGSAAVEMAAAMPSFAGVGLDNAGDIKGAGQAAIEITQNTLDSLQNSGTITGTERGVWVGPAGLNGVGGRIGQIENTAGSIKGELGHGIEVTGSTLGKTSAPTPGSFTAFLNAKDAEVIGGRVFGDSSALRIADGATVNGDIVNQGTMRGGAYGLNIQYSTVNGNIENSNILSGGDVGLYVKNSTVNGNIVNGVDGVISGGKVGVHLDGVTLNGMIDNRGLIIEGDNDLLSGLLVTGNSTLNGVDGVAIRNSGTITSDASHALKISGNSPDLEPDLYTASANNGRPVINGDIVNDTDGVLQSASWGGAALVVENAVINGTIVNRGTIAEKDFVGGSIAVEVDASSQIGGFVNKTGGVIHGAVSVAGAVGAGGMLNAGLINTRVSGLELVGGGKADGAIRNEGTIAGDRGGYDQLRAQGIVVDGAEAVGGVQNTGTISGVRDGMVLTNATVSKGVLNDGQITLSTTEPYDEGHGINIGSTESVDRGGEKEGKTHIVGDVVNSGSIVAGDMTVLGTERDVDGIHVEAARINGNLINSGTIAAEDDAIQLEGEFVNGDDFVDVKLAGSLVNTVNGKLTANDDAVDIQDAQIGGDIRNDGTIVAGDKGYEIDDLILAGNFVNAGSIDAQGDAVNVEGSTITGRFENTGRIVSAEGDGVSIGEESTIGKLINNGSIIAANNGIGLSMVNVSGDIQNSGRIEAEHGAAILLDEGTRVQGAIRNTNSLIGGIELNNATLMGGIDNAGVIEGFQFGIGLYDATVGGVRIGGTVKADLFAIALQGNTNAGGLALQGQAGQTAVLEGKGYSVLMLQDVTRANLTPLVGGVTLAGYSQVKGDMYTPNDSVTVKGIDNRISGALEVQALEIVSGGELVLESLNSTSARHEMLGSIVGGEWLPKLADALKSSDGVANNGRLVLAKAEAYKVIGNYSQAADATLAVRATGDDSYSKLLVDGTATLASGSKIAVDVRQDSEIDASATSSNTLFNTNRLAGVIQATNLVSDGKFTVSDNSALFDFGAEIDKNDSNNVDLVLKRAQGNKKPVYLEQIVKDNKGSIPLASQDAARVLDKITDRLVAGGGAGAMAPVIDALGRLGTNTELAQAVEQLTPALPSAALSAVSDSLGAINRVVQARVEGNIGLSSGDEPSAERYVWVKPFGSYAKQDARSETAGFKANTGGLVFGADAAISPKLRLGVALAYAHSDVDGKSASAPQSSKVDVYQLIGYGSVQLDGNTEFNFQLDGGRNRNQGERQLSFMGVKANSDYDSLSYHMGAGIGRTFALPREITTTPSLRLDYTRIKEDGYSETGAGAANLINGKRSVEQTLLAVDNRVTLPLNARQSLSLNAGAAYDLMNDGAVLTSAFAGESGALFSTEASGQSRWLWRAGIGHTYKADTGKGGLELSTRLDGEWRKGGYSNATASVKARYAF